MFALEGVRESCLNTLFSFEFAIYGHAPTASALARSDQMQEGLENCFNTFRCL